MCDMQEVLWSIRDFVKSVFLFEFLCTSAVECLRDRTTILLSASDLTTI